MRRSIAAIERSEGRDAIEIIVVDNASTDGSAQIEDEFPNITMLRLPRNFGLTRARNIAIRTARAPFLFFLDPAVEVLPDTLSELARILDADSDVVAAVPLISDTAGQVLTRHYRLPSPEDLYRIWQSGQWPTPLPISTEEPTQLHWTPADAMLIRASFIRGMNYLDERYAQHWSDLDLCRNIARSGKKLLLIPRLRAIKCEQEPYELNPDARALLSADLALGAAAYVSKYFGFTAGLRFRIRTVLASLGSWMKSLLRARDVGYRFHVFMSILSGQRIDGSQGAM